MSIEAVVFDWGGTLTPWSDVDLLDLWRVAADVLAPDRREELAAALLAAEGAVWARVSGSLRSATTAEVLAGAAHSTGLAVQDLLHERAILAYLDAWARHTVARPEAAAVLGELRAAGLGTGLLSNTHWPRDRHERWLARDGLLELLDARVYTSDLPVVKPHPEAFLTVLAVLGVAPERAVFVGDRPVDDIEGAHHVGMRTVLVHGTADAPAGRADPDAVVSSLAEVPPLIARWRRRRSTAIN